MITQEMNDRFTQVGPGTPMGNLLRRYWQVVGIAQELEKEPVQPVRLLGEDLTLFRYSSALARGGEGDRFSPLPRGGEGEADRSSPLPREEGEGARFGLIAARCAHRGLSLAYGIPQENGLRCAYHGWTYNAEGQVVDMPFEPACLPLKVLSYPVQELGGLVFAYLGPEPAPLLPRWDLLADNDLDKEVDVELLPCNWLQCMDNSLDPVHFEHLHGAFGNYVMKKLGRPPMLTVARHLKIDFDAFEYGIYKRRLVEGEAEDCDDWTIGHPILFPNILAQGDAARRQFQIRVPADDTHTMHYFYIARTPHPAPPHPHPLPQGGEGNVRGNGMTVRRTAFFEDPEAAQRGGFVADIVMKQDLLAWVAQGYVCDRTQEHLATSDRGLLLYRNMLLDNMTRVERGEDPIGVIRDPAQNEPMIEIRRETKGYTAFGLTARVQDLEPTTSR